MSDYCTVAQVRYRNAVFSEANIPTAAIDQFIDEAQLEINTALGLDEDISGANIARYNVTSVATALCAFKCVQYNTSTFADAADAALAMDAYWADYHAGLDRLKKRLGEAVSPTFRPKTQEND